MVMVRIAGPAVPLYGKAHFARLPMHARSRVGRRVLVIAEDFAQRLGGWAGLSRVVIEDLKRAAESFVLEETRARALQGDADAAARLKWFEEESRRAQRVLGFRVDRDRFKEAQHQAEAERTPTIEEVMAANRAARLARGRPQRRPRGGTALSS